MFSFVGIIDEIILEGRTVHKPSSNQFKKDNKFINGLLEYQLQIREHIKVGTIICVCIKKKTILSVQRDKEISNYDVEPFTHKYCVPLFRLRLTE